MSKFLVHVINQFVPLIRARDLPVIRVSWGSMLVQGVALMVPVEGSGTLADALHGFGHVCPVVRQQIDVILSIFQEGEGCFIFPYLQQRCRFLIIFGVFIFCCCLPQVWNVCFQIITLVFPSQLSIKVKEGPRGIL
jgi:hypothetical protein